MINAEYKVAVEIDGNVWMDNYGEEEPLQVVQDVLNQMQEVIEELVSDWIAKSGNVGRIKVVRK